MKTIRFVSLFLTVGPLWTDAAPLEDLVTVLPDYGRPPTPHFSGYLDATAGCDTASNGAFCKLHYWLALAEDDPWNKPVVLWLNGGPGSSSILGFLQENGPLLINATGGLDVNPWSWTNVVNLLALEAPVGVGYSYCANQLQGQVCHNTDKDTASASRAALQDFFGTKFPELASNDFFITGESYAGVYIPTLSKEILDHAPEIQLKGVAVGDPCTDNDSQKDSMDALWFGYKYGLVDPKVYDLLWNTCQARAPNLMVNGGVHTTAALWNRHLQQKQVEFANATDARAYATKLLRTLASDPGPNFTDTPECRVAFRKYLWSTSRGLSQSWNDLWIDDYSLFAPVTNQQDDDMAAYMQRPDVREALHVTETPITSWPYADVGFDYTKQYNACNGNADADAPSMIDFYRNIIPRLQVTWIYNGDTDPCVSYEGTRTAVERIGLEQVPGGNYRPWFYNQTAASIELLASKAPLFGPGLLAQELGAQFGGEFVNYEHGLAFLTVHGSGHMVPQFRPQAALHVLERLVNYADLSPLSPLDSELETMDDDAFQQAMNNWTDVAMGLPYVTAREGPRGKELSIESTVSTTI